MFKLYPEKKLSRSFHPLLGNYEKGIKASQRVNLPFLERNLACINNDQLSAYVRLHGHKSNVHYRLHTNISRQGLSRYRPMCMSTHGAVCIPAAMCSVVYLNRERARCNIGFQSAFQT